MTNSSFVVTVETGEPAALALIENESIVLAADAAQLIDIALLGSNPGMAAVEAPSRTMVAVANKVEIVSAPVITQGGLATINLSPSLEFIVPTINIF